MQRVEILAKGDVQRVGFRDVVQKIARDLDISGMVQNLEPYDVRIVAEGQEDALKEFVRALRIQKRPIQVRELEVSWASATGEFPYFKIVRGKWQDELGERLDFASGLLYRTADLVEENLAVSKENLAVSKENLVVSKENLVVSKENLAISKEILGISNENLSNGKSMLNMQEETLFEIRGMRSDLHEYMDRRFAHIEEEIAEIKRAMKELSIGRA